MTKPSGPPEPGRVTWYRAQPVTSGTCEDPECEWQGHYHAVHDFNAEHEERETQADAMRATIKRLTAEMHGAYTHAYNEVAAKIAALTAERDALLAEVTRHAQAQAGLNALAKPTAEIRAEPSEGGCHAMTTQGNGQV